MLLEIRDADAAHWSATGWATTWAGQSQPYFIQSAREGVFLEQVARNAFSDATAGRDPAELRLEHRSDSPVLASVPAGTMRLRDEPRGLLLGAALSKADEATRLAVEKVHSGTYSGLSVGMSVSGEKWGTASDGRTALRTITRASLTEVSIVHRPANPAAQMVEVRQENRSADGHLIEYRSAGGPVAAIELRGGPYAAHQLAVLGSQGMALGRPDGSWWLPTADSDDLQASIEVVGNMDDAAGQAGRAYLIARALAMGLTRYLPSDWTYVGQVKPRPGRSALTLPPSRLPEFELELAELRSRTHGAEVRVRRTMTARAERAETREAVLQAHLQRRFTNSWRPEA